MKLLARLEGLTKTLGTRKEVKTESANAGAEKKECPELWCWDCGQHGHVRTSCPEHFKFKPRAGKARPPQQARPSAPSRAEPMQAETSPKEEGNESRPQ